MKVLVTGAAGFIGSHAAERLQQEDLQVVGVDNFSDYYSIDLKERNAEALRKRGVEVTKMDLRESNEYAQLPADFDFIIHFAAQPGIAADSTFEEYFSNNVIATQKLLEFAHRNANLKHFFNIATSSIYGLEATFPETVSPKPASWYAFRNLPENSWYWRKAGVAK